MKTLLHGFVTAIMALTSALASAQSYPSKPVKVILPFGPGSSVDLITRALAEELRGIYGQPFLVDYKEGASGRIGAEAAAKSPGDGYTLFVGSNSTHSVNPYLYKNLSYDPMKDFTPISSLAQYSSVLVTYPSAPFSNVKELVDYARANPGKVSYGYGNTTSQVAGATLFRIANAQVLPVAYKSNPLAAADVAGGQVSVVALELNSGLGLIKGGKVKVLAAVREKRVSMLPDLPAVAETSGFEGFGVIAWNGVFGPAGLSKNIAEGLSASIRKSLAKPEIKGRFEAASAEIVTNTPDQFRIFLQRQLEVWGKNVRDAGIQPE